MLMYFGMAIEAKIPIITITIINSITVKPLTYPPPGLNIFPGAELRQPFCRDNKVLLLLNAAIVMPEY
jgi:hypothetical protein